MGWLGGEVGGKNESLHWQTGIDPSDYSNRTIWEERRWPARGGRELCGCRKADHGNRAGPRTSKEADHAVGGKVDPTRIPINLPFHGKGRGLNRQGKQ